MKAIIYNLVKTEKEVQSMEQFDKMMLHTTSEEGHPTTYINGGVIATRSIYANSIQVGAIQADHIRSGSITSDHISTQGITADNIKGSRLESMKPVSEGGSMIDLDKGSFIMAGGNISWNNETKAFTINATNIQIGNNPVLNTSTDLAKQINDNNGVTRISGNALHFDSHVTMDKAFIEKLVAQSAFIEYLDSKEINADLIKSGTLEADHIKGGTLDFNLLHAKHFSADNITSGAIDASIVNIDNLSASRITTGTLSANKGTSTLNMSTGDMVMNGNFNLGAGALEWNKTTKNLSIKANTLKIGNYDAASKNDVSTSLQSAKNYTEQAIQDIEIGGRNYLRADKWGSYSSYNTIPIVSEDGRKITFTRNTTSALAISQEWSLPYGPNVVYTFSGIVKINGSPVTNSQWTYKGASTYQGTVHDFSLNNSTGEFIITQSWTSSNKWILHGSNMLTGAVGSVITIEDFKMEKGNTATDWTPAPEDVQAEIDSRPTFQDFDKTNMVTINGGNIKAGTISSKNSYSKINLDDGTFSFGNGRLVWNGSDMTVNGKISVSNITGDIPKSKLASGVQTEISAGVTAKSTLDSKASTWDAKETTSGAQAKANTAEANAKELANAMAFGKMLYTDPTFKYGNNSVNAYNNSGGTGVTIDRIAKQQNAPTDSTHILRVTTSTAATSPELGGFSFQTMTSANKTYITRFIAKIPSGRSLIFASNATGSGGNHTRKWLSSNQGTGRWEEYVHKVTAGDTGSFSSTNFFYISGGSKPLTWYIAYATVFDVTDDNLIAYKTDAWSYEDTTEINGSSIRTGTLDAKKITTGTLSANKGTSTLNMDTGDMVMNGNFNLGAGALEWNKATKALSIKANSLKIGSYDAASKNDVSTSLQSAKDYTKQSVDGIDIGGTNLIKYRVNERPFGYFAGSGASISFDENTGIIRGYNGFNEWPRILNNSVAGLEFELGKEYTLSFEARADKPASRSYLIAQTNGLNTVMSASTNVTTQWTKVVRTFTPAIQPSGSTCFQIYVASANDSASWLELRNLKLEKGNRATDWSPAPEDLYQYVDGIEIGGRNLLRDSGRKITSSGYNITTYNFAVKPIAGEKYTLSVKGKINPQHHTGFYTNIYNGSAHPQMVIVGPADLDADGVYRKTFTMPHLADYISSILYSYPLGKYVEASVEWIKLEKGNKATDWTPAPEDVQSQIDEKANQSDTEARLNEIASELLVKQQEIEAAATAGELDAFVKKYNQEQEAFAEEKKASEDALASAQDAINLITNKMDNMAETWEFFDEYIKFEKGSIVLGNETEGSHVRIHNDRISFYSNGYEVAAITQGRMTIEAGTFVEEIQISEFKFQKSSNGHLTVRYVG